MSVHEFEAQELAAYYVEGWDMETLVEYAVAQLAKFYQKNPGAYEQDLTDRLTG